MSDPRIPIVERALKDERFSDDTLAARILARLSGAGYRVVKQEQIGRRHTDGSFSALANGSPMSERLTIKVYRTAAYRTVEKGGKQSIELYMVDVADVIEPPESYNDEVRDSIKRYVFDTAPACSVTLKGIVDSIKPLTLKTEDGRLVKTKQVGWFGPYGMIPGGMDVDPAPKWKPIYVAVEAPE